MEIKEVTLNSFLQVKLGFKERREIRDLFDGKVRFREENGQVPLLFFGVIIISKGICNIFG